MTLAPAARTRAATRDAAREILAPATLRAALHVTPADATVAAALRCGLAVALALVVAAATGHRDLAGFAALGALASVYGRYDPYRRRAVLLAVVGVVLVVGITLTGLTTALGAPVAVTLVVVAALAGSTTAFADMTRLGPPGATIVVFAAGAGMAGSPDLADVGRHALAAAVGVAIAWVVCTAGYLARPTAPARLAVRRAGDAARHALDGGNVDRAQATVAHARRVLADDASHERTRPEALRLAAQVDVIEATLTPAGVQHGRWDAPAGLPARTTLRRQLALAARAGGWWQAPARVAAAALVAAGVAQVAGFGHPVWAAVGATATLQGVSHRHAAVRGLQRAAGTCVGALLAWPLLELHLGFWAAIAVIVVLQVVTEMIVGRHYGVAMLTITPMALLMTSLAAPATGTLALDRALDTVIGALIGVVVLVVVPLAHGSRVRA
ncbi:fusaric acid resistance family protein [Sediminihabitans luteus]|uniref:Fusaric acid resistance family protein n=1 Tax=Sediminihabitans luteus TaxID=1138585 RepID=A0A2M9D1K9_9CELL|nr:FUSC family protein [Sediminihabitans luteus]PJJ77878.1 fusaric acid resistance family protein [Sediminihabitans luteus]GII99764.1 hypothetical protein Slu03_21420 [Sediminihabitans luteus]